MTTYYYELCVDFLILGEEYKSKFLASLKLMDDVQLLGCNNGFLVTGSFKIAKEYLKNNAESSSNT